MSQISNEPSCGYGPLIIALLSLLLLACSSDSVDDHSFGDDVAFLKNYVDLQVINQPDGPGQIAISRSLQARVMTSSTTGAEGRSHGWINRKLFESGDTLPHINAFGGEERFWLGPEGGQFSIFFKGRDPFDLEHWQTPYLLDLQPFDLHRLSSHAAVYRQSAQLTNYIGFIFVIDIQRRIEVLSPAEIRQELGLASLEGVANIGYRSTNTITNRGNADWTERTGMLSIWLLGMFPPSDSTTVVIPYITGDESLGPIVNDSYFGKVSPDRLQVGERAIFFRADGQLRSKIGLLPQRSTEVLGAFDAINNVLTVVKFMLPRGETRYVNSLWKIQDQPFAGDAINSYNDGPPEPGAQPLGPFYELETSSPALSLTTGSSGVHVQSTFHFEGPDEMLDEICRQVLNVSLEEMERLW